MGSCRIRAATLGGPCNTGSVLDSRPRPCRAPKLPLSCRCPSRCTPIRSKCRELACSVRKQVDAQVKHLAVPRLQRAPNPCSSTFRIWLRRQAFALHKASSTRRSQPSHGPKRAPRACLPSAKPGDGAFLVGSLPRLWWPSERHSGRRSK